jgi:hypothetical protein
MKIVLSIKLALLIAFRYVILLTGLLLVIILPYLYSYYCKLSLLSLEHACAIFGITLY